MQINVAQQLKADIGEEKQYEVNEDIDIEGCNYHISGKLDLTRTDNGILIKGVLSTGSELICSRCLKAFDQQLGLDFEELYTPTLNINTGAKIEEEEEPGILKIDDHNVLDAGEAIRQYALLAIPMKPLCREDCAGICRTCGKDLNSGACGCPQQPTDPRWDALKKIRETNNSG